MSAPGDRLGIVLLLCGLGENAAGFDRIGVLGDGFASERVGCRDLPAIELIGRLREQAGLVPAFPPLARRGKGKEADSKPQDDKERDKKGAADAKPLSPGFA